MVKDRGRSLAFLNGGGHMGELIRKKDWSATPIGEPHTWPQNLRIIVSILLNSQFPMFVWWGKELVTLYNDPYVEIAGKKHPDLLGKSGKEAWAEIWHDLDPLVESVFNGKATWSEDQPLFMNRQGYYEQTYFTFSYSPVFDDAGIVCGLFCACIETTEKVMAAEKIRESERNLRATILQAPVAMCILRGPSFTVEIANTRMYELWGRPESVMLNKPIFEGLPEASPQVGDLLSNVYTSGETFTANELLVSLPRGEVMQSLYLNFVYEPFREMDGSVSGIIVVATEVTEQVLARLKIEDLVVERTRQLADANESLTKANEELQQSNTNLAEFAYAASHDLKEPSRKIQLFADRLKNSVADRLTETEKHFFERMELASTRMTSLIDDLLTYSEVGQKRNHYETFNVDDVVQQVINDLDLEIEQRGATIEVDTLFTYTGLRRQLQQAFHNLIVNALKYARPGVAPVIKIKCSIVKGDSVPLHLGAEERASSFYQVEVYDNGAGFGQEDAEKIFNVFTRLHDIPNVAGTGVGLSIVRKVMHNHNGYVWAQSKKDEGATFYLLLPFQTDNIL